MLFGKQRPVRIYYPQKDDLMTDSTNYNVTAAHITRTADVAGGKPCIAGRRIRVQDVYIWHEHHGMSADEIASEYNLTLIEVYAALTFAFEHLTEIQEAIRQSDQNAAEIRQKYPSKLNQYKRDE